MNIKNIFKHKHNWKYVERGSGHYDEGHYYCTKCKEVSYKKPKDFKENKTK